MAIKGAEKIVDALTQLMDGYCELQESLEHDYGAKGDDEDEAGTELSSEVDAALVTELRATIETVMEEEDYTAEEIASVISVLTDALEEIDPEVFEEPVSIPVDPSAEYDEDDDNDDSEEEDDDDDEEEEE